MRGLTENPDLVLSSFKCHGNYCCQLNNVISRNKYYIQHCENKGRMTPEFFYSRRCIVQRKHFKQKRNDDAKGKSKNQNLVPRINENAQYLQQTEQ